MPTIFKHLAPLTFVEGRLVHHWCMYKWAILRNLKVNILGSDGVSNHVGVEIVFDGSLPDDISDLPTFINGIGSVVAEQISDRVYTLSGFTPNTRLHLKTLSYHKDNKVSTKWFHGQDIDTLYASESGEFTVTLSVLKQDSYVEMCVWSVEIPSENSIIVVG